tara:strand:- start:393 stop:731 length:339 start_codon:yes stop_codon:yes gene_type:complete
MRHQYQKTLQEFDLRLTEVCSATRIDAALEKQREMIRLLDDFAEQMHLDHIERDELIEINHAMKDLLNDSVRNRNHLGDFNAVYEEQNDEIIDQIRGIITRISRILRKRFPN